MILVKYKIVIDKKIKINKEIKIEKYIICFNPKFLFVLIKKKGTLVQIIILLLHLGSR